MYFYMVTRTRATTLLSLFLIFKFYLVKGLKVQLNRFVQTNKQRK